MYMLEKVGDCYMVCREHKPVRTPRGIIVLTKLKKLGARLVTDLEKHGEDPLSPASLAAFHYPFLDFFLTAPRHELENPLLARLEPGQDWTLRGPRTGDAQVGRRPAIFTYSTADAGEMMAWLATLNRMQLCAVSVLGRALDSVNIPYILSTASEEDRVKRYSELVTEISAYWTNLSLDDLVSSVANYLFYCQAEEEAAYWMAGKS